MTRLRQFLNDLRHEPERGLLLVAVALGILLIAMLARMIWNWA